MAKRLRPDISWGLLALSLVCLLVACGFALWRFPLTWYHLLAGWLLSINVVTFGLFGFDKLRAGSGGRRVPELALHGITFLGGTIGAFVAMRFFRHKTVKSSFQLAFWWVAALQVLLIVAVVYRLWSHRQG